MFFLAAIGFIIQLVIFSFATRISPVFYWIYGVFGLIILVLSVVAGTMWQSLADDPNFADTLTRFPITDAILGSNFPIIVTFALVIGIIILFGKTPGQELAI